MLDKLFSSFAKLFGSKSDKDLKKIQPVVDQILAYEDQMHVLSDDELKAQTEKFRKAIAEATAETDTRITEIKAKLDDPETELTVDERRSLGEELDELDEEWLDICEDVLDEILPEAFATLKETCRRFVGKKWTVAGNEIEWNMVPYDVQLIGAITLHQGKIAEMKTGEGKTLVAIFPAYLNALAGRGVHVITVNNYLAKRDAEWNEPIFNFHGLRVDCIDRYEPNTEARRNAYHADITYGTNNEFGFDYLRDNMSFTEDQLVQRGHHYTIVDEVDSVLIDEARTPLIISGPVPQDNQSQKYLELKPRVASLVEAQKKLVAGYLSKVDAFLKEGNQEQAGLYLFRAKRGFPKNKKFEKFMQEPEMQKLVQQTEYFYLQDNGKNMPFVDEDMYYAVDLKLNTIEMTDKGRDLITGAQEDKEFFVIPDMGLETSLIEENIAGKQQQLLDELENQTDFSAEYTEQQKAKITEDIRREKSEKMAELYRRFAEKSERIHSVNQLLKAYTLFERDDEYIVQDGKVNIVDEHTGRVMTGRRYSDGLHQAIEAKENVKVEASTQTYATITLQNYFRMYHKLAGMTGTAATEESEFFEIYKLEVIEIPTNRPIARVDHEDLVFRTKREKFNASIIKIREYHEKGQPVLVGTTSVEVSETLSRMLQRAGIKHNVLNAKQHQRESEIVAEAGRRGGVTIATNMAGRGTDIKLTDEVKELGGLAILGTERHDSRRIDLQLRGRSGRQGDPGESQFYVSLEDNLMKLFGSDRISSVMDRMKFEEGEVIQHSWVTKSLERAQGKVEQNNFSIRKKQLEYDDVLNNQRKVVYARRRNALLGDRLSSDIFNMLQDLVDTILDEHYAMAEYENIQEKLLRMLAVDVEIDREKWSSAGQDGLADIIVEKALESYKVKSRVLTEPFMNILKQIQESDMPNKPRQVQMIFTDGIKRLRVVVEVDKAMETNGRELVRGLERAAVLSIIDDKWMEHLRELDSVKEGIGLRAFGQKDPLLEYKREAFKMFGVLVEEMNSEIISMIWKAMPEGSNDKQKLMEAKAPTRRKIDFNKLKTQHESPPDMSVRFDGGAQTGNSAQQQMVAGGNKPKQEPVVIGEKVKRNDPCPCGSGKKYKHCHGAGE
ncbi:MAG: preprotein translocase subunit SecA [Bacteroidetes bacterium HLUCCA01]|nr:MAG: preprotein translocase subunit SecA [Bacteroidetes bacterium HLUCCA01]